MKWIARYISEGGNSFEIKLYARSLAHAMRKARGLAYSRNLIYLSITQEGY